MSLENSFERIADALEALVAQGGMAVDSKPAPAPKKAKGKAAPAPEAPAPAPQAEAAPNAAPSAPPASPAPSPQTAPAPQTTSTMTSEQLNEKLKEHFYRLGSKREPIDQVMREQFQVQSINDLPESQYQALVDAVAAIQG